MLTFAEVWMEGIVRVDGVKPQYIYTYQGYNVLR